MSLRVSHLVRAASASLAVALSLAGAFAAEVVSGRVDPLVEQNRRLQEQVRLQQQTIDRINARLTDVLRASERHERELRGLNERVESAVAGERAAPATPRVAMRENLVRISAETGLAFFRTGRDGQFPEGEFRADDPMISVEAPVAKNVFTSPVAGTTRSRYSSSRSRIEAAAFSRATRASSRKRVSR
ncbi:MAG: hypothetical protein ACREH8_24440 [Opitutaceae bacterium]